MAGRQGRRQLQFSSFELAMIAVAFLLTVTSVFFLGLYVGKKNASVHASAVDRVARIPVDDFTRYKRPEPIRKPEREKPVEESPASGTEIAAAAPANAASSAKAAAAPAPADTKPAAATTPAAATPPAAPLQVASASPAAASNATPPADAAAKAADAAKAKELAAAQEREKQEKAKLEKEKLEKEKLEKAKQEKEKAKEAEAETGRGYTVQILSTRKQAEADALVKKLKSRGYAAYIKKVSEGEGAWYRVRVGSYGAFSEARGMADKCRRDLGLGQAFVSTE